MSNHVPVVPQLFDDDMVPSGGSIDVNMVDMSTQGSVPLSTPTNKAVAAVSQVAATAQTAAESSPGILTTLYDNKMLVFIIVLSVIILILLSYIIFNRNDNQPRPQPALPKEQITGVQPQVAEAQPELPAPPPIQKSSKRNHSALINRRKNVVKSGDIQQSNNLSNNTPNNTPNQKETQVLHTQQAQDAVPEPKLTKSNTRAAPQQEQQQKTEQYSSCVAMLENGEYCHSPAGGNDYCDKHAEELEASW